MLLSNNHIVHLDGMNIALFLQTKFISGRGMFINYDETNLYMWALLWNKFVFVWNYKICF